MSTDPMYRIAGSNQAVPAANPPLAPPERLANASMGGMADEMGAQILRDGEAQTREARARAEAMLLRSIREQEQVQLTNLLNSLSSQIQDFHTPQG